MFSSDQNRTFEMLQEGANRQGVRVFVVGGVVRDLLLDRPFVDRDIDFVVEGDAINFAEELASIHGGTVKRFEGFRTAKILGVPEIPEVDAIDLASARREVYERPGALPTVESAPIEEDLRRRDFTINAMAIPLDKLRQWEQDGSDRALLEPYVLDVSHGLADLSDRIVRTLHERSFVDDPTRLFRGCRYVGRIEGKFAPETAEQIRESVRHGALATISYFRKFIELRKIAEESDPPKIIPALQEFALIESMLEGEPAAARFSELVFELLRYSAAPSSLRFDSILVALAAADGLGRLATKVFNELGISKKKRAVISSVVAEIPGVVAEPIGKSDLELLVAAACSPESELLHTELHRRGFR